MLTITPTDYEDLREVAEAMLANHIDEDTNSSVGNPAIWHGAITLIGSQDVSWKDVTEALAIISNTVGNIKALAPLYEPFKHDINELLSQKDTQVEGDVRVALTDNISADQRRGIEFDTQDFLFLEENNQALAVRAGLIEVFREMFTEVVTNRYIIPYGDNNVPSSGGKFFK